jgi:hypothetical protein
MLPSADELLGIAQSELGWDMCISGLQHPALLGGALHLRRGRVAEATRLVAETLQKTLHSPFNRVEAHRLLARCHIEAAAVALAEANGDARETHRRAAADALKAASQEAAAAGYVLLDAVAARDLLRLHRAGGRHGAADEAAAARALEALRAQAGRLLGSPAEIAALLGPEAVSVLQRAGPG